MALSALPQDFIAISNVRVDRVNFSQNSDPILGLKALYTLNIASFGYKLKKKITLKLNTASKVQTTSDKKRTSNKDR